MSLSPLLLNSFDGTPLAVHRLGPSDGRPTLLVHGFLSTAAINWFDYGTAATLVTRGAQVFAPDLRGHGQSGTGTHFPPDVLAQDLIHLVRTLNLAPASFDIVGYSLGARTLVRALVRGLTPRRAILAGMGLTGITDGSARAHWYADILRGTRPAPPLSPESRVRRFLTLGGANPDAAARIIADTHVDTPLTALAAIHTPLLVVAGDKDQETGSIAALAQALGNARAQTIPGTHMDAITRPAFGAALADFFTQPLENRP